MINESKWLGIPIMKKCKITTTPKCFRSIAEDLTKYSSMFCIVLNKYQSWYETVLHDFCNEVVWSTKDKTVLRRLWFLCLKVGNLMNLWYIINILQLDIIIVVHLKMYWDTWMQLSIHRYIDVNAEQNYWEFEWVYKYNFMVYLMFLFFIYRIIHNLVDVWVYLVSAFTLLNSSYIILCLSMVLLKEFRLW